MTGITLSSIVDKKIKFIVIFLVLANEYKLTHEAITNRNPRDTCERTRERLILDRQSDALDNVQDLNNVQAENDEVENLNLLSLQNVFEQAIDSALNLHDMTVTAMINRMIRLFQASNQHEITIRNASLSAAMRQSVLAQNTLVNAGADVNQLKQELLNRGLDEFDDDNDEMNDEMDDEMDDEISAITQEDLLAAHAEQERIQNNAYAFNRARINAALNQQERYVFIINMC